MNKYDRVYLFTRPDPATRGLTAYEDYNICKGIIKLKRENKRQSG